MSWLAERIFSPMGCLKTIAVIALGSAFISGAVLGNLFFHWLK